MFRLSGFSCSLLASLRSMPTNLRVGRHYKHQVARRTFANLALLPKSKVHMHAHVYMPIRIHGQMFRIVYIYIYMYNLFTLMINDVPPN